MEVKQDIGNVDAALEELGPISRYTMVQFFMQILALVAVAHHMLSIVFTGQENPFRCSVPSVNNGSNVNKFDTSATNSSGKYYDSNCYPASREQEHLLTGTNVSSCNAYNVEYQLPKDRYFVSEFDLICDREYLAGITQTLLTLGHAVGSLAFPYFADNYGRKPTLLLCSFLWLGSALGLAFSVNYVMFAAFKSLVGVFLQGVSQTSGTVMVEILTGNHRGYMIGCLAYIFWTVGIILMVPVAYVLRYHSWRVLELAYCSYFVFIILYVLLMDESLRWLAANGLRERVMRVLKKASRWNGSNFDKVVSAFYEEQEMNAPQPTYKHEQSDMHKEKLATDTAAKIQEKDKATNNEAETVVVSETLQYHEAAGEKLNFISLFTNRYLVFCTAFYTTAWFFNSLTYYGLFLMSSSLSGSLYLNYFLNCSVELPSAIFIYFYIDRLGRRGCFSAFSVIAGLSLVGMAITSAVSDDQSILITVLAIIGKFGISGSFATIYTFTHELLPTTIRNTGMGLANMFGCLGGMLAPFSNLLMSQVVYAPGIIFGSGSLVLSVWTYFLPETARRQLPQSLRDIENWSKPNTLKKQGSEAPSVQSLKKDAQV